MRQSEPTVPCYIGTSSTTDRAAHPNRLMIWPASGYHKLRHSPPGGQSIRMEFRCLDQQWCVSWTDTYLTPNMSMLGSAATHQGDRTGLSLPSKACSSLPARIRTRCYPRLVALCQEMARCLGPNLTVCPNPLLPAALRGSLWHNCSLNSHGLFVFSEYGDPFKLQEYCN